MVLFQREADCETMSMEMFTRIEKFKLQLLSFALEHYNEALKQVIGNSSWMVFCDIRDCFR